MGIIKFNQIMNVAGSEQILTALQKSLEDSETFQTYDVVVLSDHASYVEYGTGPATKKNAETDVYGQSVKEIIERWVTLKFGANMTKKQRRDFAYSVYKKIMQNGLTAKPYIRPAIISVTNDKGFLNEVFANSKDPLFDIATEIAEEMKDNLNFHDSIFTHELINSIKVTKGAKGRFLDNVEESSNTEININSGDAGGK